MAEWSNVGHPLRRVLVVGPPGVGKSWVSVQLASILGIPHVELDGFKLRPVRQLTTADEYEAAVRTALAADAWLLDGNWSDDTLGEDAWRAADLVVWLDYPRPVVMRQVAIRSARRLVTREDYYGWTESVRDWFSPTHPLRWSWRMVAGYADRYSSMAARFAPRNHVRLTSREAADRFVHEGPLFSEP
ncbi:MAG TPA: AAA family ATPase [Acidimicrobiia bacterium]|nr:AAA family ATPase [Acidimicrobiia bacterium]